MDPQPHESRAPSIWFFAFGYFACYAPYSALTKALSKGLVAGSEGGISGFELLPSTAMASLAAMLVFITAMGWWKHAGGRTLAGVRVPMPGRWTFLSGLCSAAIIGTTTLAYTFSGVSIVFMMLLMRGGLLVIAPIVDLLSRRKVRWFSWVALLLSFTALLTAVTSGAGWKLTLVAVLDVAVYLTAYLVRLQFMSRLAKSDDHDATVRYFVEEHMVAAPALLVALGAVAVAGAGAVGDEIRAGFTTFFSRGVTLDALIVGVLSEGTGIFGGLILLDKRENTFCVPVNRASSVLAGVVASGGLTLWLSQPLPRTSEFVGAGLIIAAIFVLAAPSLLRRRPAPAGPAPATPAPAPAPLELKPGA